ncbi:7-methyl-GTP pyrophosphatase [Halomonadaceae bacterium LMG 33818]|uniref:Maf family protein n=1 Tax=Cernens ardua TaxID=3402176 RepID=UPI003EDB6C69
MVQPSHPIPLILASSSPYRRTLLERLKLPFQAIAPDVDETPTPEEGAPSLARRLALTKAKAIHKQYPNACVIGSDQVCAHAGRLLGKAGSAEKAHAQLASFSGDRVTFYTGLALIDGKSGHIQESVESYNVDFRQLSDREINHYLEREHPFDSAGSFYMEGLGVALFTRMEGDDPTTLMGLPLIRLCEFLRKAGIDPLM